MAKRMKTVEAARHFAEDEADRRGMSAMARSLGISRAAVYKWGKFVPELRTYQINAVLAERGKGPVKRG